MITETERIKSLVKLRRVVAIRLLDYMDERGGDRDYWRRVREGYYLLIKRDNDGK